MRTALAYSSRITLGIVLSLVAATLPLMADVSYEQTVRYGTLHASVIVQSRVPLLDPPVFDIPVTLYAPPLDDSRPVVSRILLSGDRLIRIGKDQSAIFDLNARTVTVANPKTHNYSIETFDDVRQRFHSLFDHWTAFITDKYTCAVQKTGQTTQIEGQTAEEYRIIGIMVTGRHRVQGSSVYWMVPKPPSDELAAFRLRWSRELGLPFPGMPATPAIGDISVFGAMASAASKLGGSPIHFVVESRPLPGAERIAQIEPISPVDPLGIRVTDTAFSGFNTAAVDPSVFSVPAACKKTKTLRYMPD